MLSAIIDRIKTGVAVHRLRKLPAVDAGGRMIKTLWIENKEVNKDFSPEFVKRQGETMMEEIIKVAVSPDPRMANRLKLRDLVIELAQVQVLVIDPPPSDDPTGLRGQLGITGELKPRLFELYQVDKTLQEIFYAADEKPEVWDDVWNVVLFRYRQCWSWTHVFGELRAVYDDQPPINKDWFGPFLAAMCGFQENSYRRKVGLSPVLEPSQSLGLSMFEQYVRGGGRYPDLEWNNELTEFDKGDSSWRANSWLAKEKYC